MGVQLLQFRVEDRLLAVPVDAVREVVRAVALTEPVDRSRRIEGFLNLRGRTLPVVDLRGVMGLPDKPTALTDALVVIGRQEAAWALRAEGGLTTVEAAAESIQLSWRSPLVSESVQVGGQVTFLLDLSRLQELLEPGDSTSSGDAEIVG